MKHYKILAMASMENEKKAEELLDNDSFKYMGTEGAEHRKEIEQFAEIVNKDNIKFSHITYQEVIGKLSKEFYTGNENYCNYITVRYL